MEYSDERFFRVISNQVKFGCGYRDLGRVRQYFAWHGVPRDENDYITTTEISEYEFNQIAEEYPEEIAGDRDDAMLFRSKYIRGHLVLLEGWDISL